MATDESSLLVSSDRALLDVTLIHRFLSEESYWARGRTQAEVEQSIAASACVGVYRTGADASDRTQLAFGRAVTDSVTFAWICDVFVVPSERGRGHGRLVMESLLAHPSIENIGTVLLRTKDAHDLYRKLGFELPDPSRYMQLDQSD